MKWAIPCRLAWPLIVDHVRYSDLAYLPGACTTGLDKPRHL